MPTISATTSARLTELHRLANAPRAPADAVVSALLAIANAGEPLAIPRIISLALDRRREVATAAGDAVKQLRDRVSVRDLGLFDRAFRDVTPSAPAAHGSSDTSQGPYRTAANVVEKRHVFAQAMRDRDPTIRGLAGHWLIAGTDEEFAAFSDELLAHRLATIRFGTAQRLAATRAELPWSTLLFDPHAGVRALAQHAALAANRDPDAEYRAKLPHSQGAKLGIVLLGLSETGGPADAIVARSYLRSEQPSVRSGALHALASFKVEDLIALALTALVDPSARVNRTGRDLLVTRIADVRASDVWSAFVAAPSPIGKRWALAVISRCGFWDGMVYMVRAFDLADSAVRHIVLHYLERWRARYLRTFVELPPSTERDARNVLRASSLPDIIRRQLTELVDARVRAQQR
ncbi:MAG: hypothetical protein AB7O24_04850 [Kofleriaceae bacterium]